MISHLKSNWKKVIQSVCTKKFPIFTTEIFKSSNWMTSEAKDDIFFLVEKPFNIRNDSILQVNMSLTLLAPRICQPNQSMDNQKMSIQTLLKIFRLNRVHLKCSCSVLHYFSYSCLYTYMFLQQLYILLTNILLQFQLCILNICVHFYTAKSLFCFILFFGFDQSYYELQAKK